jgi:serine/threonine protein phosphatase 1
MATYCISDIHGHYREFLALLDQLAVSSTDQVYILGDIIDRGPNIAELLLFCVGLDEEYDNFHFLVGNHERMSYQYLMQHDYQINVVEKNHWLNKVDGSKATIEALNMLDPEWIISDLIPWFDKLSYFQLAEVNGQSWMLVHAGFDPKHFGKNEKPVVNESVLVGAGFGTQSFYDMLWIREDWIFSDKDAPLPVVHGHTPTIYLKDCLAQIDKSIGEECYLSNGGILYYKNKIDIDCGAGQDISLGALRLDDFEEFHVAIE